LFTGGDMTKDEALELAIKQFYAFDFVMKRSESTEKAIAAIKQALAAQPAVQEPVAWRFTGVAGFKRFVTDAQYEAFSPEVQSWYEPFKCSGCTTPPAAAIPDAITDDSESPEYRTGWNDYRQAMMEMMK
jgi:hypothetical protein